MSSDASHLPALTHNGRVLLVGVACIGVILIAGKGVPTWLRWRSETTSALARAELRVAEQRRVLTLSRGADRALDLSENTLLGLSPAFLKGASASQGAAALAALVADAGEANGVQLSSLQPDADSTAATLIVPVTVRASGTGDVRGVAGMLRDLEGNVPLLDVRQITIGQADPAVAQDRMETLRVELTIRGLYRRVPADMDTTTTP